MYFKRTGDKQKYNFVDAKCIGRTCWSPGMYQHRSPLSCGGSRNTGSPDSPCCLNRAYRGCPDGPEAERTEACQHCKGEGIELILPAGAGHPDDLAEYQPCCVCRGYKSVTVCGLPVSDPDLAKQRKSEGWRVSG